MMLDQGREVIAKTLASLVDYTKTHFAYEERIFEKHDYPETPDHLDKHRKLVAQVVEFKKNFDSGKSDVDHELMTFLKNWLIQHIMGTDKRYSSFMNGKGIV